MRTQLRKEQLLDRELTGASFNSELLIYDETYNYNAGDIVWWKGKFYRAKNNITGSSEGDLSKSPDKDETNWELYITSGSSLLRKVRVIENENNIDIQNTTNPTIDGITLQVGDKVFLNAQNDAKENGYYIVDETGKLVRDKDFPVGSNCNGTGINVIDGNNYKGHYFVVIGGNNIGTDEIHAVDQKSISSYQFLNGLTEDTSSQPYIVKLGGDITEFTYLNVNNSTSGFYVRGYTSGNSTAEFSVRTNQAWLKGKDGVKEFRYFASNFNLKFGYFNSIQPDEYMEVTETDGFIFHSDVLQRGISYADDYSANFTDRTLVDKAYVDNAIANSGSSGYQFSNGLTEDLSTTPHTIKLGGILNENTSIDGSTQYSFTFDNLQQFNLYNKDNSGNILGQINLTSIEATLMLKDWSDNWSAIQLKDRYFTVGTKYSDSNEAHEVSLHFDNANTSGIQITDQLKQTGLYYKTDYSSTQQAGDRWLTDKGYVDSAISSATAIPQFRVPFGTGTGLTYNNNFSFTNTQLIIDNDQSQLFIGPDAESIDQGIEDKVVIAHDGEDVYIHMFSGDMSGGIYFSEFGVMMGLMRNIASNAFGTGYAQGLHLFFDDKGSGNNDNIYITYNKIPLMRFTSNTISAENNRIQNVGDPINNFDAVNLRTLNNSLSNYVNGSGSQYQVAVFQNSNTVSGSTDLTFINNSTTAKLTVRNVYIDGEEVLISGDGLTIQSTDNPIILRRDGTQLASFDYQDYYIKFEQQLNMSGNSIFGVSILKLGVPKLMSGNTLIEYGGLNSSAYMSVEEDNVGDFVLKYNATFGQNENYINLNIQAARYLFSPTQENDKIFSIDFAPASTSSTITWQDILKVGLNTFTYKGFSILTENNAASVLDDRYVNVTGDTMTGNLNMNGLIIHADTPFIENTTTNDLKIESPNIRMHTNDVYIDDGDTIHFNNTANGTDILSLQADGYSLRVYTPSGYVMIGPRNSSWSHFYTNRSSYWFDKRVTLGNGQLAAYSTNDLVFMTNNTTERMRINHNNGYLGVGISDNASINERVTVNGFVKATKGFVINRTELKVTAGTTDWFRIASGSGRCSGKFRIKWSVSGQHGATELYAGCHYNDSYPMEVKILSNEYYGTSGLLRFRVLEKGTYDEMYIDIQLNNIHTSSTMNVEIEQLTTDIDGWNLVIPPTAGATVPSGYTEHSIYVADKWYGTLLHHMFINGYFRSSYIRPYTNFVSSDGSPGITETITLLDTDFVTEHKLTFKNGILVSHSTR